MGKLEVLMKTSDKTLSDQRTEQKKPGVHTTRQLKAMQTKIQEAEDRFQVIFDNSPDGMVILNPTENAEGPWLIEYCNRSFCEMNGFDRSELVGKDIRVVSKETATEVDLPDKYHEKTDGGPSNGEAHRREYYQRLKQGPIRIEEIHKRKDGSTFHIQTSSCLVTLGGQERVLGIDRNITERKQAEEELKKSEGKFKAIFNNASDGMFVVDLKTKKFFMCNTMCAKMLGYTKNEFINLDITDIHPGEDLPFINEQIWKFSRGEEGIRSDIRFKRKDGSIFVADLSPALLTIDEKEYLLINIKDITERKQNEEQIQILSKFPEEDPNPILRVAADGILLYANQSSEPLLAMWNTKIGQAMPADWQTWNAEVSSSRQNKEVEIRCGERVFSCILAPIVNAGYVNVYGREITKRKQAEKARHDSEVRYRGLFEDSPFSLLEEDFSSVKQRIEELRGQGIVDFRAFFEGHPEELAECAGRIKILDVNKATLELLRAKSKADLIANLNVVFASDSLKDLIEEFVNIADGKTEFEWEGVNHTLDGDRLVVNLRWSVVQGCERLWRGC